MFEDDLKEYPLFISHNGEGDEEYLTFIRKLIEAPDFKWQDHGLPGKNSPDELLRQIEPADMVIILTGLYSKHRDLIKTQVKIARELKKTNYPYPALWVGRSSCRAGGDSGGCGGME